MRSSIRRRSPLVVLTLAVLVALALTSSASGGPAEGKEACMAGGYEGLGFPNQGQCIKAANEAAAAGRPFPPRPPGTPPPGTPPPGTTPPGTTPPVRLPLDTTPPDTVITAGPAETTDDQTPTFTFTSTEPGSRFECSIDAGPFFPCSSPFTTPRLSPGLHTFEVRAIDAAGNVDPSAATSVNPTAARRSFTVLAKRLAPPVLGRAVNAEPITGDVFISLPRGAVRTSASVPGLKGRRFIPLREARQLPVGTLFDTRRGKVRLTTARNRRSATQSGEFLAGVFQVAQSRSRRSKGLTTLRLKGSSFRSCVIRGSAGRRSARAHSARRTSRRTVRRLRGRGSGRFRTRGRHSSATVRGTDWTVSDRCDGTLTRVRQGKVTVRDFRARRTVRLGAGKRYLARARS